MSARQSLLPPGRLAAAAVLALAGALLLDGRILALCPREDDFVWLVQSRDGTSLLDPGYFQHFRPVYSAFWRLGEALVRGPLDLGPVNALRLAVHLGAAALLGLLAGRVGRDRRAGWLAATLFLCAGGTWENLGWASAVGEPLAALFLVLAMLAYLAWLRGAGPAALAGAAGAGTLAVCSKEPAAVYPLLLAALHYLEGNPRRPGWLAASAPVAVLAPLQVKAWALAQGKTSIPAEAWGRWPDFLSLVLWPPGSAWTAPPAAAAGAVLLFLAAVAAAWVPATPGPAALRLAGFGLAWIPLALLPYVLGFEVRSAMARYGYLPALGLAMAAAGTFLALWSRLPRAARWLPAALLAGMALLQASAQIRGLEGYESVCAADRANLEVLAGVRPEEQVALYWAPSFDMPRFMVAWMTGRPLEEVRPFPLVARGEPARVDRVFAWNWAESRLFDVTGPARARLEALDRPAAPASASAPPTAWGMVPIPSPRAEAFGGDWLLEGRWDCAAVAALTLEWDGPAPYPRLWVGLTPVEPAWPGAFPPRPVRLEYYPGNARDWWVDPPMSQLILENPREEGTAPVIQVYRYRREGE